MLYEVITTINDTTISIDRFEVEQLDKKLAKELKSKSYDLAKKLAIEEKIRIERENLSINQGILEDYLRFVVITSYSIHYTKLYDYIELPTEMQLASYRLTGFNPDNPYIALDDVSQVATLIPTGDVNADGKPYYRGKVRINIWVEGWVV